MHAFVKNSANLGGTFVLV